MALNIAYNFSGLQYLTYKITYKTAVDFVLTTMDGWRKFNISWLKGHIDLIFDICKPFLEPGRSYDMKSIKQLKRQAVEKIPNSTQNGDFTQEFEEQNTYFDLHQ